MSKEELKAMDDYYNQLRQEFKEITGITAIWTDSDQIEEIRKLNKFITEWKLLVNKETK